MTQEKNDTESTGKIKQLAVDEDITKGESKKVQVRVRLSLAN